MCVRTLSTTQCHCACALLRQASSLLKHIAGAALYTSRHELGGFIAPLNTNLTSKHQRPYISGHLCPGTQSTGLIWRALGEVFRIPCAGISLAALNRVAVTSWPTYHCVTDSAFCCTFSIMRIRYVAKALALSFPLLCELTHISFWIWRHLSRSRDSSR